MHFQHDILYLNFLIVFSPCQTSDRYNKCSNRSYLSMLYLSDKMTLADDLVCTSAALSDLLAQFIVHLSLLFVPKSGHNPHSRTSRSLIHQHYAQAPIVNKRIVKHILVKWWPRSILRKLLLRALLSLPVASYRLVFTAKKTTSIQPWSFYLVSVYVSTVFLNSKKSEEFGKSWGLLNRNPM